MNDNTVALLFYAVMGLLTAFTVMISIYYNDQEDGVIEYAAPTLSGALWPVAIPMGLVFLVVTGMTGLARKTAKRMKANRK